MMPGYAHIQVSWPPMMPGPMGPIPHMGMPPGFMPPGMPMGMAPMPRNPMMPPSTMSHTIHAPPKPLFPAAVAQATTSSHAPVGTDFQPIMSTAARPTFPAYSGNNSPSISGQPSKTQVAAPVLYNAESTSSPQINSQTKQNIIIVGKGPSTKIMHPDEDISLEELRAAQYNVQNIMNGMNIMGMPPGMVRMPSPYGNQGTMYSQGMMGQGASRPY
ncbi:hypothetical protein JTE90_004282 [Oedothorax gibbosus]|uniref:Uncharacterized protein n=1 Tax=Oedothorax gibbosus TaxID=931172 RepID=A0AAV6VJN8_9ARAC|nr:hypothetical protein JTE90_004282 [Oedothorax gibbosus]